MACHTKIGDPELSRERPWLKIRCHVLISSALAPSFDLKLMHRSGKSNVSTFVTNP